MVARRLPATSVDDAKDPANVLKSGKMAAKVDIVSDTVIGPSLGKQAIHDGFLSFAIALVLLMVFTMAFYGFIPGLIANIGLVCNLFFTFGILASFQAVLTLSGIAGIVLALGMAVDANVLIFERAKEEPAPARTSIRLSPTVMPTHSPPSSTPTLPRLSPQ